MKRTFLPDKSGLKNKLIKRFFLIFILVGGSIGVFAQDKETDASLSSKTQKCTEVTAQSKLNKYMLTNRDFVLEANYLQNKFGDRFNVNSNINFVAVDSTTAVIQIGSDWRIGANGVGGVTAKGNISNWKLTENKKDKSYVLYFNVMTTIGIYDLTFNIDASGHATALLTGMTPGQLTFDGNLVPYSESSVYEGMSL